ncbi:uncharacterized protein LOC134752700 [Cydia strobilella]|uniref:uncharacterized protein LOC134752700 n=1 Tax=Cydia strobilella TaxID=1100964 RepID=UPI0030069FDA
MARVPQTYSLCRPGLMNHHKGVDNFEVTSCTPSNRSQTIMGQVQGTNNIINTNDKRLHENTAQVFSTPLRSSTISCPRQGNVLGTTPTSSTVKNGSNGTEAWRRNKTGVENPEQDWSTVHTTPTISCPRQGNVSGTSVPSSSRATNPITPAEGFGEKNLEEFLQAVFEANLTKKSKKKLRKLITHGVPEEEASELCLMSWTDILKKYPLIFELAPASETKNTQDSLSEKDGQGSAITTNTTIRGQESLKSQNIGPIRVGIQNKEPMNSDQMKMVHRHLLVAITKHFTGGDGPEFLSFTHKNGWIQVTCVDQRSKDWLMNQVQNLEPSPGMRLSVMPEWQLPNPPKVVTKIPGSEAGSVQEALKLLKSQNIGLNTGHWQLLHERVEKDKSRTVTFIIDEKSLATLIVQKLKAALGFKIVTFRVKTGGSQLMHRFATQDHDPVSPDCSISDEDLGLTYAKNNVETDRDKHSSTQAKGNERSGIIDLTVPDQDGFAALAAAERVTSQAKNGFGAKFTQNKGVIDLTGNDKCEVYGNRSRAKGQTSQPKFGSRPTIQNSLRPGDVRLGQGSKEVNQTPVRGSQSSQNGAHLTEYRDRTPSPEDTEEGGYSSWIIQEPENFAAGIVPGLSFLNSGGPPQLTGDYEPGNIQDPTRTPTGLPSEGRLGTITGQYSKDLNDRLPKSYRLPVKRRRKDRRTDRDRPPRLNRPSPQRGNSQDLQIYDRLAYCQDNDRSDTVKSWENSSMGYPQWRDDYYEY